VRLVNDREIANTTDLRGAWILYRKKSQCAPGERVLPFATSPPEAFELDWSVAYLAIFYSFLHRTIRTSDAADCLGVVSSSTMEGWVNVGPVRPGSLMLSEFLPDNRINHPYTRAQQIAELRGTRCVREDDTDERSDDVGWQITAP
jgi:hypothetical protein